MARPRSKQVQNVKAELIRRLRGSSHGPGSRFLSGRAVAKRFHVSYQTADRLLRELTAEGLLQRRLASGTYVPGQPRTCSGVELIFHPRARRAASFGARLAELLESAFLRACIAVRLKCIGHGPVRMDPQWLPVIWECPAAVTACVEGQRPGIMINDLPPAGLGSLFLDSICIDDFAGGAMAADLLAKRTGRARGFAVLAGPCSDARSAARVAGFRSRYEAAVVAAPSWYVEGGLAVAARVLRCQPCAVFCCNDRLAEGLILWCQKAKLRPPVVVGFDDAPVADRLGLTTISIPWAGLAEAAVAAARRRIDHDQSGGLRQVLSPRPVVRWP